MRHRNSRISDTAKLLRTWSSSTRLAFSRVNTSKKDADVQVASTEEPKKKEMSSFVINDERMPKYAALVEFILPLLVASSYFSYRYLTTGSSMF